MIKRMSVAFVLLAFLIWGLVHLFLTTPTSFVPNEDQGYLMAQIIMPDAASLIRTSQTSSLVDELFANDPAVANRTIVNGYSLIDGQYKSNVVDFFRHAQRFQGPLLLERARPQGKLRSRADEGRRRSAEHQDRADDPNFTPGDSRHRDDGWVRVLDTG